MIVVFRALRTWWRAYQRHLDMQILWPICVKGANDLDHAKAAFATHCFNDPAWLELGEDAMIEFIDRLGVTTLPVANRQTIYSESNDPRLDADYQPPPRTRGRLSRSAPPTQESSGLHRPQD